MVKMKIVLRKKQKLSFLSASLIFLYEIRISASFLIKITLSLIEKMEKFFEQKIKKYE